MKRKHIRIAIMGAKRAGKTVLLAAIDNYLHYLNSPYRSKEELRDERKLLDGWTVKELSRSPTGCLEESGWEEFPATAYRDCLAHPEKANATGGWPEVTCKPALLAYDMLLVKELEGGKSIARKMTVELLDIPGERMTDVATMWGNSFEQWNRAVLDIHAEKVSDATAFKKYVEEVCACVENGKYGDDERASKILDCYKDFVQSQIKSYSPFITPSTAQLDGDAHPIKMNSNGEMDKDEFDVRFAPLPTKFLTDKKMKSIVRSFSRAYEEYQKQIHIEELVDWFSNANQIYYLVDEFAILQAGNEYLDGVQNQIDLAFSKVFQSVLSKKMRNLFGNRRSRVCAVATQVDRTDYTRDEDNIKALLEVLFTNAFKGFPCKSDYLSCSAVPSMERGEDGRIFGRCRLHPEVSGNLYEKPFVPCKVPSGFFFENNEKYEWPYPESKFPKSHRECPKHVRLDTLLGKMLELDLEEEGVLKKIEAFVSKIVKRRW